MSQSRHNSIAAPSFSHLPWFADHPTNAKIAQESYLLQDILPRLSGRILLLGFSKSGNGAVTLLLRADARTVDVWIGRLRRALKTAGAGNPLRTVRSLGYVLDLP